MQQFIEKDADGPYIDGVVVLLLEDHLGGHILIGATESFPFHGDVVGGPSQVTDLDVAAVVEEDIFTLNETGGTLRSRCMMS